MVAENPGGNVVVVVVGSVVDGEGGAEVDVVGVDVVVVGIVTEVEVVDCMVVGGIEVDVELDVVERSWESLAFGGVPVELQPERTRIATNAAIESRLAGAAADDEGEHATTERTPDQGEVITDPIYCRCPGDTHDGR